MRRLLREEAGGATGDENLYWLISPELPRETRDYVPLTLAMAHIPKDPARYGFTDLEYQEPLEYEKVAVAGGTNPEQPGDPEVVSTFDGPPTRERLRSVLAEVAVS